MLVSCVPGTASTAQYTCPPTVLSWADGDSRPKAFRLQVTLDDIPRLASWLANCDVLERLGCASAFYAACCLKKKKKA